jgi:hypothetical protein
MVQSLLWSSAVGLPLLAVSGEELVGALQRGGFRAASRSRDAVILTNTYRDVIVPLGPIGGDTLLRLLRAAGVPYATFLDLLEQSEPDPLRESHVRRRTVPDLDSFE